MKDLQDMAARVFSKSAPADGEIKRKPANKGFSSNTNVSPLGRFLLSRFVRWIMMMLHEQCSGEDMILKFENWFLCVCLLQMDKPIVS